MEHIPEFISRHPMMVMSFVVVAVLLIASEMKRGGKSLSPTLVGRVVNKENGVLVDIRDDKEFRAGHITGSIGIPQAKVESRLDELEKHKGKPVVVVCAQGVTAGAVANTLVKAGHDPVYVLAGGIAAWRGENLPVVRG